MTPPPVSRPGPLSEGRRGSARIAILVEQLEDREVANYLGLAEYFDIDLITTQAAGPYGGTGLGLPVIRCSTLYDRLPRRARQRVAVGMSRRYDIQRVPGLNALLDSYNAVVAFEPHLAPTTQACQLRSRGGPPVVVVSYETIPFRYDEALITRRRKIIAHRWADMFIARTPQVDAALAAEGVAASRRILVPAGVQPDRFHRHPDRSLRTAWDAQSDDVVLVYTGRLIQEKGLVPLLISLARRRKEQVRLVLVGEGPELPRIRAAAEALGIADRVHHTGWVSDREIPRVLASADVFVLPSLPTPYWEEQLGFSLIEAMAAGLPTVAVASGAIPFVLGSGGLTAPPYDLDGLADALDRVLESERLRDELGAAARERVARTLNTQRASEGLATVLAGLIRSP